MEVDLWVAHRVKRASGQSLSQPDSLGRSGQGVYWLGGALRAVSAPSRVCFSTVGAPCQIGQVAFKNGFQVAPTGARTIEAAVFSFRVLEGA